jgi:pimeloyl-ACP methyl ester carboxylesterase
LAADVIGSLDLLEVEIAYICGYSLGGMIAQNMAFKYLERMAGTICMGSSTGGFSLPPPTLEAQKAMSTPSPQSRDKYIEHTV